jgi:hypothetical protein
VGVVSRRPCHCGESGFYHCSDLEDEIARMESLLERAGLSTGQSSLDGKCGEHGVFQCKECDPCPAA